METIVKNLTQSAGLLSGLFLTGSLLMLWVVVGKCLGNDRVKFFGSEFKFDHVWLVIAVITLGHLFLAWLVMRPTALLVTCGDAESAKSAWNQLTNTPATHLAFVNLSERASVSWFLASSITHPRDLLKDTALLYQLASAALLIPAVIRIRGATWRRRVATSLAALILFIFNWAIVSAWSLAAADLRKTATNSTPTFEYIHINVIDLAGLDCDVSTH